MLRALCRLTGRERAVLAACAAAGSVIAGARGFTLMLFPRPAAGSTAPGSAPIDALVAADPPANGKLTLISNWPRHWTTVAWVTRRDQVCWATFRTPMQGATEDLQCPDWDRSQIPASGSTTLSSLDADAAPVGPYLPGRGTLFPLIGLASPQTVRVMLTAFGEQDSAPVLPVPIGAGKTVGVFLVWLAVPGNPGNAGYRSSDITSETTYAQDGRIISNVNNPP